MLLCRPLRGEEGGEGLYQVSDVYMRYIGGMTIARVLFHESVCRVTMRARTTEQQVCEKCSLLIPVILLELSPT